MPTDSEMSVYASASADSDDSQSSKSAWNVKYCSVEFPVCVFLQFRGHSFCDIQPPLSSKKQGLEKRVHFVVHYTEFAI